MPGFNRFNGFDCCCGPFAEATLPCGNCQYVAWNNCCPARYQFFRLYGAGYGLAPPVEYGHTIPEPETICGRLTPWPLYNTPEVPFDGGNDPLRICFFLEPTGDGKTWQRLHGFGGVTVRMELSEECYSSPDGVAFDGYGMEGYAYCEDVICYKRIVGLRVDNHNTGERFVYACRNGKAYVNRTDVCADPYTYSDEQCFPYTVGWGQYAFIKRYPAKCWSGTVSASWSAIANAGPTTRCACLNKSKSLHAICDPAFPPPAPGAFAPHPDPFLADLICTTRDGNCTESGWWGITLIAGGPVEDPPLCCSSTTDCPYVFKVQFLANESPPGLSPPPGISGGDMIVASIDGYNSAAEAIACGCDEQPPGVFGGSVVIDRDNCEFSAADSFGACADSGQVVVTFG